MKHDWLAELICKVAGHWPNVDGDVWWCRRCQDVLPEGNKRRQP